MIRLVSLVSVGSEAELLPPMILESTLLVRRKTFWVFTVTYFAVDKRSSWPSFGTDKRADYGGWTMYNFHWRAAPRNSSSRQRYQRILALNRDVSKHLKYYLFIFNSKSFQFGKTKLLASSPRRLAADVSPLASRLSPLIQRSVHMSSTAMLTEMDLRWFAIGLVHLYL